MWPITQRTTHTCGRLAAIGWCVINSYRTAITSTRWAGIREGSNPVRIEVTIISWVDAGTATPNGFSRDSTAVNSTVPTRASASIPGVLHHEFIAEVLDIRTDAGSGLLARPFMDDRIITRSNGRFPLTGVRDPESTLALRQNSARQSVVRAAIAPITVLL